MTAYGFKSMFVAPIRAGTKIGTIRAPRKRHVRPGEAMQLYCGMRRKGCFKIIDDVTCLRVNEITLDVRMSDRPDLWAGSILWSNGVPLQSIADLDAFAVSDGFVDFAAMATFWRQNHGDDIFHGVHIIWGTTCAAP